MILFDQAQAGYSARPTTSRQGPQKDSAPLPRIRTVMILRTNSPRTDTAATLAMFRAMRPNAFCAEVQKLVEKIAVCERCEQAERFRIDVGFGRVSSVGQQ